MSKLSEKEIEGIFFEKDNNIVLTEIACVKTYNEGKVFKIITNKNVYFLKLFDDNHYVKKLSGIYGGELSKLIPLPKLYCYNFEKPPYYVVLENVEGVLLRDMKEKMSQTDLKEFYYDLGKVLGRIHSQKFDQFGEVLDSKGNVGVYRDVGKGPFKTWKEMHRTLIDYRLKCFENSEFQDVISLIREYFKENEKLIDFPIVPRLLHIDLHQGNIFVKDNKVSGIIDFEGCFVGHVEEELMRTVCGNFDKGEDELNGKFLDGYKEKIKLDMEKYEKRRPFYYLSRILVHIGCLISWGTKYKENVKKETEILKDLVKKIVNYEEFDYFLNN